MRKWEGWAVQVEKPTAREGKTELCEKSSGRGECTGPRRRLSRAAAEGEAPRSALPHTLAEIPVMLLFRKVVFLRLFPSPVGFLQNSKLINPGIRADDLEDGLSLPGPQGTPKRRRGHGAC